MPNSKIEPHTPVALISAVSPVNLLTPMDHVLKEELARARLSHLGFDLEKAGFEYIVRDRREHLVPALQPKHCQDLNSVIDLSRSTYNLLTTHEVDPEACL